MHISKDCWELLVTMKKSVTEAWSKVSEDTMGTRKMILAKSLHPFSSCSPDNQPEELRASSLRTLVQTHRRPWHGYHFSKGKESPLKNQMASSCPNPDVPYPLCSVQKKNPSAAMVVFIKFSCISCVEAMLKQGVTPRTRKRACVWWESGTQQFPWLTRHMGGQFLTDCRVCSNAGRTLRRLYSSVAVSHTLCTFLLLSYTHW